MLFPPLPGGVSVDKPSFRNRQDSDADRRSCPHPGSVALPRHATLRKSQGRDQEDRGSSFSSQSGGKQMKLIGIHSNSSLSSILYLLMTEDSRVSSNSSKLGTFSHILTLPATLTRSSQAQVQGWLESSFDLL